MRYARQGANTFEFFSNRVQAFRFSLSFFISDSHSGYLALTFQTFVLVWIDSAFLLVVSVEVSYTRLGYCYPVVPSLFLPS